MSYDVDQTPRSVELQRELEEIITRMRGWIAPADVVLAGALAYVGYVVVTTDPSTSTTSAFEGVTIVDMLGIAGAAIAAGIAFTVIVVIHELCHVATLEYLGYRAEWSVSWFRVRGREIYPFAVAGSAGPTMWEMCRMKYWEAVAVSLAPLALSATVAGLLAGYHVYIDSIPYFGWVVGFAAWFVGPSTVDLMHLSRTPRERYDRLVGLEERVESHAAAEGIDV